MIPKSNIDVSEIEIEENQPSLTYALDIENKRIRGKTDNIEAVKQAVYLILNTERYDCLIFSWNYGAELKDLIGEPKEYAYSEIKRCITEALLQDDRIVSVDNFRFEENKRSVTVIFTVNTIFGDLEVETNV